MKIGKAVCYSFHSEKAESLAQLRLIGPLQQAGIGIINGIEGDRVFVDRVSEADIVIIQRDFPRKFADYRKIVEKSREERKPVVFDLDDLLFCLPKDHPGRQAQYYAKSLVPMFEALVEADLVTVSTPKLGEVLGKYNDNVAVLPNYFDDNLWQFRTPGQNQSTPGRITIGYMGGFPHKPDLECIAPVMRELIERYPDRIRFQFWGIEPPEEVRAYAQVAYTLAYSDSYKDFAAYFQAQSADIFIAPLADNLFNRCKSPVKFFEYGALGAPGVYSNLETYSGVVEHGRNGLLASSPDEWRECIIQLIEEEEMRYEMARNAQATIRADWLLSQNAYRWGDAYRGVAGVKYHKPDESEVDLVGSIHTQILEVFTRKGEEIDGLTRQFEEREHKMNDMNEEFIRLNIQASRYAMSKSWRLTRPFRKMVNRIKG